MGFAWYELVSYSSELRGRVQKEKYLPPLLCSLIRRGHKQEDKLEYMVILQVLSKFIGIAT